MTKRAPWLLRRSTGRTTRMVTESGVFSISTFRSSAASCVGPYLVPLMSTVSWSQPEISTEPLKVSTASFPPACNG